MSKKSALVKTWSTVQQNGFNEATDRVTRRKEARRKAKEEVKNGKSSIRHRNKRT